MLMQWTIPRWEIGYECVRNPKRGILTALGSRHNGMICYKKNRLCYCSTTLFYFVRGVSLPSREFFVTIHLKIYKDLDFSWTVYNSVVPPPPPCSAQSIQLMHFLGGGTTQIIYLRIIFHNLFWILDFLFKTPFSEMGDQIKTRD